MTETDIINEIIKIAKSQKINQGELATRAGSRQETLSRARKNSTLRFKTVQQLAQIVGLKLKLIPDNPVLDTPGRTSQSYGPALCDR
jgi:uncharacterized protein YnzC (UPF0291/DUF896 family)